MNLNLSKANANKPTKKTKSNFNKIDRRWGLFFVAPAAILFTTFVLIPVISIIVYSFTEWNGMSTPKFIGFQNYIEIFRSSEFVTVITNNIKFLVLGVPLWTFFPLFVAFLLFEEVKGWKFFRSAFFFPTILSTVIVGSLAKSLFQYDGMVNNILINIGLERFVMEWWASGTTAIPIMVLIMNWVGFGSTVLIYLAAMSNLSSSVLEASLLDGVNWFQKVRYIVLPQLKGVIQLNVILNIMYCFTSLFGYIYVITKGGPGYETTTIDYFIYQKAFTSKEMGFACALSVFLAFIVAVVSLIQYKLFNKKEGEI